MGAKPKTVQVVEAKLNADRFGRFCSEASTWLGSKWAFVTAGGVIVVWGMTGPVFHFSDTWQLIINTGTTIVTFLMVFLIQNTQNRDARAINLKLDELIRALDHARNHMINIEKLSDADLDVLEEQFTRIRKQHEPDQTEAAAD
ncbi:low affinity iron permease family protein [Occallatibacter riparius]|uniref:Low affinity iron permease family protein n=1 Tax=Occallatibacter riparius TaxID=1002689 RepID=A0A9J7BS76_9BACT|nr:low affinity iron permease family protein [Occallatibacter riparius]UWZ85723.1 low affinity iron permease family protein [Occallatibacter riparius]